MLKIPGTVLVGAFLSWLLAGGSDGMESWVMRPGGTAASGSGALVRAQLDQVDWRTIAGVSPTLAMLVVFLAVILLTDAAGLELALGRHLEPNQVLETFGLANAAAGAIGGFASAMSISATIMAHRSGAACRLVGVTSGLVCLGLWFVGPELSPAWLPRSHNCS